MNAEAEVPISLRAALPADAGAIVEIYNHYVTTSVVSFEEQVVSPQSMLDRMAVPADSPYTWLIAEHPASNELTGFAYSSPWRARSAYRYTVEISVYIKPEFIHCGIGSRLYSALFESLQAQSVRMIIATIALPNDASIALHEKFGLKKVAHYPEVGFKFGQWVDVGVWQGRVASRA